VKLSKAVIRKRLLQRIEKQENGCWLWTGSRTCGYGSLSLSNKTLYAHRLAYEVWIGPVPKGHWVLHRCGNRMYVNPAHLYTNKNLEERLLRRIEKHENGCWIWHGHTKGGYGRIDISGYMHGTHRIAYQLWIAPIPKGLQVQQLCGNTLCCNPAHLVAGTAAENAALRAQYSKGGHGAGQIAGYDSMTA
jgi:hypothetical protein